MESERIAPGGTDRIYVHHDYMFPGIGELVYPGIEIVEIRQKSANEYQDEYQIADLHCPNCGQSGLVLFENRWFSGRHYLRPGKNGLNLDPDPEIQNRRIEFSDEDFADFFFDEAAEYTCPNCGHEMVDREYLSLSEIHGTCPGCPLCKELPTREEVKAFCVRSAASGCCYPGESCRQCNAWYGRVIFSIANSEIVDIVERMSAQHKGEPAVSVEQVLDV